MDEHACDSKFTHWFVCWFQIYLHTMCVLNVRERVCRLCKLKVNSNINIYRVYDEEKKTTVRWERWAKDSKKNVGWDEFVICAVVVVFFFLFWFIFAYFFSFLLNFIFHSICFCRVLLVYAVWTVLWLYAVIY